ncbi:glutathione peroxidase [Zooshikella harenae]|uniref:Glutathione peroxidase n=1 Tax=Zooshikella harenae TaxID=2827238 RepID=A0ABS5ZEM3_9GAMM|nr:glutathione peroxidase [Zooshikella harenae]MBU2712188.1 glutathione peroxidase [Zooshikella harenae]
MADSLYEIPCQTIKGEWVTLAPYQDQVMLIVNTASHCGFTRQYAELEALYQQFQEQGFVVLGFPCNQFLQQEPGSENEIAAFCEQKFQVSFPMFAKVNVNGENAHPLYGLLKRQAPGLFGLDKIKWNFTKFLVSPQAKTIQRFSPITSPLAISQQIEGHLMCA